MLRKTLLFSIGSIIILGTFAGGQVLAQCGPGDHWIDSCVGGQDSFPSISAIGGVDISFDCGTDVTIPASGSAVVQRADPSDDSQNYPGTRPIDGHDDVIDTEILSMTLTGSGASITAGAGQGYGGALSASNGIIAEQLTDPALGESFFDLYLEAYLNGFYAYNHVPIRVQATLDRFPPYGVTYTFNGCIPAYSSPDSGQGAQIGNITSVTLTINEPSPIPTLNEWGLLIMSLLLLAFVTTAVIKKKREKIARTI